MVTPDWPHTRAQIIDAFDGEHPGAPLEAALVDIYEANPQAVINAIDSIATSLKQGKINSGWAVLRKAAGQKAIAQTNPTISRDKLIRNAEQWMRNTGLMYDRWTEARDELFGERGRLHQWRTDTKLNDRLHTLWTDLRPAGEQVEADEHERAERWKESRARLADKPNVPLDDAALRALATLKGQAAQHPPAATHPNPTPTT